MSVVCRDFHSKMILIVAITCLIASASGYNGCNTGPDRVGKVFKAYDTDGDGKISRSEGIAVFRTSDSNSDGFITPDEFSTEWTFYHETALMPFFSAGDKNQDGLIDFAEGNKGFDFFDINGDGVITLSEFSKTWNYTLVWFESEPTDQQ